MWRRCARLAAVLLVAGLPGTVVAFSCGDTLVDSRDSQSYPTVAIGAQCWMAANMKIGTITPGADAQGTDCSSAAAIEKYCYNNDSENCYTFGGLYQWGQTMCGSTGPGTQGICPDGWHVATDAERHTLGHFLWDGETGTCDPERNSPYACAPAGTVLKGAGFDRLLVGCRSTNGSFVNLGTFAIFWSSDALGANAWNRALSSGQTGVSRIASGKAYGLSVRCL